MNKSSKNEQYKKAPFGCGVSLVAILALNYVIEKSDKVNYLILIGIQYKVPIFIRGFQNLFFAV